MVTITYHFAYRREWQLCHECGKVYSFSCSNKIHKQDKSIHYYKNRLESVNKFLEKKREVYEIDESINKSKKELREKIYRKINSEEKQEGKLSIMSERE